ncbi:hypothetical protein ACEPPN_007475 [Leptodophora sp. 'Broadleaf-Isolate-01']
MLVDPTRNPVRDQHYDAQIEYHNLPVKQRQLQRKLKEHVKARRFKMAFVKKQVSEKNKEERVTYGEEHVGKTIEDFWSCITFTDEAHHDPNSQPVGYILRQEGGGRRYAEYVKAVQEERLRTQNQVYLQEDGDPSHGMRKEGLAAQLKVVNWVINLKHPAQSPDLNPIEGIWNIIKQRIR